MFYQFTVFNFVSGPPRLKSAGSRKVSRENVEIRTDDWFVKKSKCKNVVRSLDNVSQLNNDTDIKFNRHFFIKEKKVLPTHLLWFHEIKTNIFSYLVNSIYFRLGRGARFCSLNKRSISFYCLQVILWWWLWTERRFMASWETTLLSQCDLSRDLGLLGQMSRAWRGPDGSYLESLNSGSNYILIQYPKTKETTRTMLAIRGMNVSVGVWYICLPSNNFFKDKNILILVNVSRSQWIFAISTLNIWTQTIILFIKCYLSHIPDIPYIQ